MAKAKDKAGKIAHSGDFSVFSCIYQKKVVILHANLLFYASYNVEIEKYRLGTNR